MREAIEACEWPVIVTGDFNDTPQSFTYRNIRKGLNDSFGRAGRGFGRSHSDLPFLRIDYVLLSPDFDVNRYELIRNDASDHFPVLATLEKR
jgi:endonuclease/exonuclease/phosphatase family metal-dependent hydrolase